MMMTVGSALNVESHSSLFQHSQHPATDSESPPPNNALSCVMAYRFVPGSNLLSSSSYKHKLADSNERLDTAHVINSQIGSYEDGRKFTPNSRGGVPITAFSLNLQTSPTTPANVLEFADSALLRNSVSKSISASCCEGSLLNSPSYNHKLSSSDERLDRAHLANNQISAFEAHAGNYQDNIPMQTSVTKSPPHTASIAMRGGNSFSNTKTPARHMQFMDDDDDDDSWKVCGVCNDKATGYHFNALTCEGCKGFFRRSMKNSRNFTCSYNNQCNINKNNRRQCQACRLRKCIEIGMKKECIMSQDQIQLKKTLVLTNRIKRTAQLWMPTPFTDDQRQLLDTICTAFIQSNNAPDQKTLRGAQEIQQDALKQVPDSPGSSVGSSNSSTFLDLIKRISKEITDRTPSNMISEAHVLHFTDIMEFSIKEVIKFCKKIPTFMDLDLKDQIALLKSGCTEILFIKANYTYDSSRKALTLGPDIIYTRESFLQGGMSEDYTDAYLKFHEDLSILNLNDMEMASLSALSLFSADRAEVKNTHMVEAQQEVIALALQAYTENLYKTRNRFACMMAFLPKLRTLNALCTHAFAEVHKKYNKEIRPLVAEVQPNSSVS
uniref:VDR-a n=1 Tax=Phallusia mammillata TaxID=59560 RepID=A0A6F9DLX7_9ASCI|nr:VDR-a [Phallusia mammillata]